MRTFTVQFINKCFYLLCLMFFSMASAYAVPSVSVVFVLDESGSVSNSNFQLEKSGFNSALQSLPLNGSVEISIVGFASGSQVIVNKTVLTTTTLDSVVSALVGNTQNSGGTNTAGAIQVSAGLFSGSQAATKVICLATDGLPNNSNSAISAANTVKNDGVIITPIGIGLGASGRQFLDTIASDPPVANPSNFTDFSTVVTNRCVGVAVNALNVELSPDIVDFSAVDASAGQFACSEDEVLTITNRGQQRALVTSITLSGEDALDFELLSVDGTDFASVGYPRNLSALSSQSLGIALNPVAKPVDGSFDAQVEIVFEDDDGNVLTLSSTLHALDQNGCLSIAVRDASPLIKSISSSGFLATDEAGGNKVTDAEIETLSADISQVRTGLVADGNARLLLIGHSSVTSGTMRFFFSGPIQSGVSLSSLDNALASTAVQSVDIPIVDVNGRGQAVAVLTAGESFLGGANATTVSNVLSMCLLDSADNCDTALDEVTATISERRAPVVLIHGLWAGPTSFMDVRDDASNFISAGLFRALYSQDRRGVTMLSYENSLSPEKNFPDYVNTIASEIDRKCRQQIVNHKIACTRADLLGHSMGGLVGRHYIATNDFYNSATNFQQGSVRRLLTMGTPHKGSGLATLLMNQSPAPEINDCVADDVAFEIGLILLGLPGRALSVGITGERVVDLAAATLDAMDMKVDRTANGAINFLAINSSGLNRLNSSAQTVTTAGLIGRSDQVSFIAEDLTGLDTVANGFINGLTGCTANDLFQGFESDLVVSTDSAKGNLGASATEVPAIHTGMGQNPEVIEWVLDTIDAPSTQYSPTAKLLNDPGKNQDVANLVSNPQRQIVEVSDNSGIDTQFHGRQWTHSILNWVSELPRVIVSSLPALLGIGEANAQSLVSGGINLQVDSTTATVGDDLIFSLQGTDDLYTVALVSTNGLRQVATSLPITWTITASANDAGVVTYTAVGLDQAGQLVSSNSIDVTVLSGSIDLRSIAFEPASRLILFPGRSELTLLSGEGQDGFARSLFGNTNISYSINTIEPSGSTVISVDSNGEVTGLRPGVAELTATLGNLTAKLDVEVVAFSPSDADGDTISDDDEISNGTDPFLPNFSNDEPMDDDPNDGMDDNMDDDDLVSYSFPQDGAWYSLLPVNGNRLVCRSDISGCEVPAGDYILKNWTNGGVQQITLPLPTGDETPPSDPQLLVYTFPADGAWYSLLSSVDNTTVCRIDILPCQVEAGVYILKNWRTGLSQSITLPAASVEPPMDSNDSVTYYFPRDGAWYSLQSITDGSTICRIDTPPCELSPGEYVQKNWTSGVTNKVVIAP